MTSTLQPGGPRDSSPASVSIEEREHTMPFRESSIQCAGAVDLGGTKPSPAEMFSVVTHRLPSLYRHAYKFLDNKADAEDAVHDAIVAAYEHLHQFRGDAQLSTWLTTIVINCARMLLRKRSRHSHVSLDAPIGEEQEFALSETLIDHRPNPEDECHKTRAVTRVMESSSRLSPILRRAFHLRYVDHLSVCETARVLGVPIGTAKARTARARATLMKAVRGTLHKSPRSRGRRR